MDKTYNPQSFEDKIYRNWLDKKYFAAERDCNKQPFTILMPPPNITGQLHVGHALDGTLQDAIIRYKRMQGYSALFLPGTDHASIATEVKIVEKMREEGLSKEQVGREGFLRRAFDWREKYGGRIVEQQYRLGLSCDWQRSAFTMDDHCSRAVREVFVNLYNKGLIYRGDRIINWCPTCHTALSDAEVEFESAHSHLWHIRYRIEDSDQYITVATTRPETILGDTAVAVHPSDKRYAHLVGKMIRLPIVDRLIPIISDSYVEPEFGTGVVKITPAHDPNDFEVGKRHNLPIICVMDDNAVMNEQAGKYCGMKRDEARRAIVADLLAEGALVQTEDYDNNVGHCYRCHDTIEPLISKQWFVRMEELAGPAITAVKNKSIRFTPKRFKKMYLHWMENTRDWCISRQLWWGHRIPVFYCDACGAMEVSKTDLEVCPHCGAAMRRDEDTLDTWFSSALWPFATMGWPDKTADLDYFYPTDVLVTGYDIIGFWVSRMIFSGLEHMKEKPFHEVLIHGIVRDAQGRKMSKSLGNGVDPIDIIDKYGADALRFSLVNGISAGGDIKYSMDKLEGYSNFMNKIWNASKFVLMNSSDVKLCDIKDIKLTLADKWILFELKSIVAKVNRYMEKYEVGLAASCIYDFIWNTFCDWYIELSKPALYSDDLECRNGTVNVLLYVLREVLKLAHPIIPFITAEIYNELPNKDAEDIIIAPYPSSNIGFGALGIRGIKAAVGDMRGVMQLIRAVRNTRSEMNVSQSRRTAIFVKPAPDKIKVVQRSLNYIEKLACGSSISIVDSEPAGKNVVVVGEIGDVYIPMGDLIDINKELERLRKELGEVDEEIARAEGKLANAGFVAKAPAMLVEAERSKLEKYRNQRAKIEANIAGLEAMNNQ